MVYYDYDVNHQPGKDYVINHFKKNYHKGALPLMHNVSSSNCAALDEVLTFLEEKGYRFGSVDEFALGDGQLKISCKNKTYNGKPAKIKIVKNTNGDAEVTYNIRNSKGKKVKEAIEPGTYTVTAHVKSGNGCRAALSNSVTFSIAKSSSTRTGDSPGQ
jgi:hypothetical protein